MSSSLKKIILAIFVIAIIIGAIGILQRNKSLMEAKAKSVEIITNYPITVAIVKKEKIDYDLTMIGTIYPVREVNVLSETAGKVKELNFDIGRTVKAGELLVKIDDEIKAANLLNAEANYEKTKKDFERYEKLVVGKSVTDAQFDASKLAFKAAESQFIIAKRQLSDSKITSPISGIITSRNVEIGSLLSVNTPVANIVDISSLKLKIFVAEKDVFKLKVGDQVKLKTDVYPNVDFNGKISSINSKGDDAHTYLVEIQIPNNSSHPLKSGMFMRAYFNIEDKNEGLVVPRECLVGSAISAQIYVVEGNIVKLRNISIGKITGTQMVIMSGLNEGDTVVRNGQINLKDGVKVIIEKQ